MRNETFASLDEFMRGFDWGFEPLLDGWIGKRHVYRMLVPITDPVDSNVLLANYYPISTTDPAHVKLNESDGVLFGAV